MWWVVILVLGACTTQPVERARRWPNHRKETDTRFAELERRATDLEKKNSELQGHVLELGRRLKMFEDAAKPSAASPPAAPASGTP